MPLQCRFYENEFPEIGDIVVVTVRAVENMGSYVELLEYKNLCGMILHSELSRRRIRSINKLIRIGRNETVLVIRVDQEKKYIDLSKRRVSPDEVQRCQDKFSKAKTVNQILRHVAEKLQYKTDEQLEELFHKTAWHFDRKAKVKGLGAYEAFKKAVSDPTVFDECDLDPETLKHLLTDVRHRLMPQAIKLRADFDLSCFSYEGIDAIKVALKEGLKLSTDEFPIKINLIAPPSYVITTQTMESKAGLEHMSKVIEVIKEAIMKEQGNLVIKHEPRIVSDTDDAELAKQYAELEEANREVSGDEDDDENEEGLDDEDESKLRVLELFSGIGGMHNALKKAGIDFEVVAALDIHDGANSVYAHNFNKDLVKNREISALSTEEARALDCQLWTMSPPCQPYTSLGNQKCGNDNRASAFSHLVHLISQVKPPLIFLENVKEFYKSDSWDLLIESLHSFQYQVLQFILTPPQFGIPNRRRRFYLVAHLTESNLCSSFVSKSEPIQNLTLNEEFPALPDCDCLFCIQSPMKQISQFLDQASKEFRVLEREVIVKYFRAMDMINENEIISDCFTKGYSKRLTGTGSILQFCEPIFSKEYLDRIRNENDQSEIERISNSLTLRFFSSAEIARIMCFPEEFSFPETQTEMQRIRFLGNSVNVLVIAHVMHWTFGKHFRK
ncbi:Eukaryotic translation initiation factor 2 subunit 1 [Cichlidogyrus casuarinus]|uniref:Eukaryotic translation initiation factor 2 subunit 1 n=1 Tax=Cichlidogyrus casuarinus TaxID=1844966 RepID=A0ABD2QNC5_9PLAT